MRASTRETAKKKPTSFSRMMTEGRLPISRQNVTSISCTNAETLDQEVARRSSKADLVIAGLTADEVTSGEAERALQCYDGANDVLFVHASEKVSIDDRAAVLSQFSFQDHDPEWR